MLCKDYNYEIIKCFLFNDNLDKNQVKKVN